MGRARRRPRAPPRFDRGAVRDPSQTPSVREGGAFAHAVSAELGEVTVESYEDASPMPVRFALSEPLPEAVSRRSRRGNDLP
jgi:hypothetical protein